MKKSIDKTPAKKDPTDVSHAWRRGKTIYSVQFAEAIDRFLNGIPAVVNEVTGEVLAPAKPPVPVGNLDPAQTEVRAFFTHTLHRLQVGGLVLRQWAAIETFYAANIEEFHQRVAM